MSKVFGSSASRGFFFPRDKSNNIASSSSFSMGVRGSCGSSSTTADACASSWDEDSKSWKQPALSSTTEISEARADAILQARLEFLRFLKTELRESCSKGEIEAAWNAMQNARERTVFLKWLSSSVDILSLGALSFAFESLALKKLQWESLSPDCFKTFEILFRHYHLVRGDLRSCSALTTAGGFSNLPSTFSAMPRFRKSKRGFAPTSLNDLLVEASPCSLCGIREVWIIIACAPIVTAQQAIPLLIHLHVSTAPHLDACVVRHALLQGAFHILEGVCRKTIDLHRKKCLEKEEPLSSSSSSSSGDKAVLLAEERAELILRLLDEFIQTCGDSCNLVPHHASSRGLAMTLRINVFSTGHQTCTDENSFGQGQTNHGQQRTSLSTTLAPPHHHQFAPLANPILHFDLAVHDNLTIGLLRQRLTRELDEHLFSRNPNTHIELR